MSRLHQACRRLWQWLRWLGRQFAWRHSLRLHRALGAPSPRPGTAEGGRPARVAGARELARLRGVAETLNARQSGRDLLEKELARLDPAETGRLCGLAAALALHWTQPAPERRLVRRRRTLDLQRTLRQNLPRYGGRVLEPAWRQPHVWVPAAREPARLLLIGDVSHSMTGYVGAALYFFHCLHRHFAIDAWVFSSGVTHATPWLDPGAPFADQMRRLAAAASSWGQGTRLGGALEHIAERTRLAPDVRVILITDGEIMLHEGELARLDRFMSLLAARTGGVTVLTPNAVLAQRGHEYTRLLDSVSTLQAHQMHVWDPQWQLAAARYGSLARHAAELALAATVGDLCRFCERVAADAGLDRPGSSA